MYQKNESIIHRLKRIDYVVVDSFPDDFKLDVETINDMIERDREEQWDDTFDYGCKDTIIDTIYDEIFDKIFHTEYDSGSQKTIVLGVHSEYFDYEN